MGAPGARGSLEEGAEGVRARGLLRKRGCAASAQLLIVSFAERPMICEGTGVHGPAPSGVADTCSVMLHDRQGPGTQLLGSATGVQLPTSARASPRASHGGRESAVEQLSGGPF